MTKEPELVIGYGKNGNAASARCSLCARWGPEDCAPDAQGREILDGFLEPFKAHVPEKHEPRYVN
jgi:hypothetical protein